MNDATMLLRQIHPSFVQEGWVTSQAFRPTPKDENKLSVYDGDLIEPEASFHHYTERLGLASVGVMGFTLAECMELDLSVSPDGETFRKHVLVNFSKFDRNTIEKKAKLLKARAAMRDWLFRHVLMQ